MMQLQHARQERIFNSAQAVIQQPVMQLDAVVKAFTGTAGRTLALNGVNLSIPRGTIQGIIGFSGAGKSTLVRCINALERPDSGHVRINGVDLTRLRGRELRQARHRIGTIYQNFHLLHSRTALGNVALPLELLGWKRSDIRERATQLLDWVGLADKLPNYPAQLSGGQRQRVAIARALAAQPDVLLCDEATSALDPETTASILQLIAQVRDEFNVTVVLVTHEMEAVRSICDRVAVIDEGRIVEEGPAQRVLHDPQSTAGQRLLGRLQREAHVDGQPPAAASAGVAPC
jgi:D-methionine transport system ATP-binding protein